tara:strand:+ start:7007 stop:8383 length:1377 start_codon:yes stop_codon:yes gene_type:complete
MSLSKQSNKSHISRIEIPSLKEIDLTDSTDSPKSLKIYDLENVDLDDDKIVNCTLQKKLVALFTKENSTNISLFFSAWFLIWCFLIMLSLMGNGFKLLGMKDSSKMFDIVDNPISALMIGILVTVLVQSSSTSTSIIIGLVGADELSVVNAIPMIMGANIGTSVTNTIVSLGSYNDRENYQRAFAGATVHDLFNFLTVLILLPFQWATNFLGIITWELAKNEKPCEGDCKKWEGPIKKIVKPIVSKILIINKKWKSQPDEPLLKSGLLYDWKLSDNEAGILCVSFSIISLCICIYLLIKLLNRLLKGRARKWLVNALAYNKYFSIIIGMLVTILVQSSSITTSTLIPLCAINVITLEQMFPLTLGANIGTTVTGLLAASVAVSNPAEALQVALAHLLFNIMGILIWFPHPKLRAIPLKGARKLGEFANKNKFFPFLYVGTVFFAIPGVAYGITYAVNN